MKLNLFLALTAATASILAQAQTPVINSFAMPGEVVFGHVPNATSYRIEWAPSTDGPWTNTWSTLSHIPDTGAHAFTAAVPMIYRVVAIQVPPPNDMARIDAGSFVMGHATNVFLPSEGSSNEVPQHTVAISTFYIDLHEVTKGQWDDVKAFNGGNGYSYANTGEGKATNHPVFRVNWFDALKWCNARSERDGLTPVYYTDESFTEIFKSGQLLPYVNWAVNGYRLPTEAEWEKAARGKASDTRFPWIDYTNNISWAKANYRCWDSFMGVEIPYELSSGYHGQYHPDFATGDLPYTSPVGSFAPNGYGLFDMAGNVTEWCWDEFDASYYFWPPENDPTGPSGSLTADRVVRGGSSFSFAYELRVASRMKQDAYAESTDTGFRCVRRP